MRIGLGLSLFSFNISSGVGPALSAIDFDLADSAGGDLVTLTGARLSSALTCSVGGTSATITSNTATSLTFTMPTKTAGTYDIRVTTAAGTSNALSIEAWAPTDDSACTLLFDAVSNAYNAGTGIWVPRYSAVTDGSLAANGGSNQPAVDGAPSFDGDGSTEAGMANSSARTWDDYIGTAVSGQRAGTVASVFSSTNTNTLTPNAPYNNPSAVIEAVNGTIGLGFGNASGTTPSITSHVYDGAYKALEVAASANTLHAVVSRWGLDDTLDLSLDGALSGGSYASRSVLGTADGYTNTKIYLGVRYPGSSAAQQTFEGVVRSFAILNSKASDAFISKFYKWAKIRHGVS